MFPRVQFDDLVWEEFGESDNHIVPGINESNWNESWTPDEMKDFNHQQSTIRTNNPSSNLTSNGVGLKPSASTPRSIIHPKPDSQPNDYDPDSVIRNKENVFNDGNGTAYDSMAVDGEENNLKLETDLRKAEETGNKRMEENQGRAMLKSNESKKSNLTSAIFARTGSGEPPPIKLEPLDPHGDDRNRNCQSTYSDHMNTEVERGEDFSNTEMSEPGGETEALLQSLHQVSPSGAMTEVLSDRSMNAVDPSQFESRAFMDVDVNSLTVSTSSHLPLPNIGYSANENEFFQLQPTDLTEREPDLTFDWDDANEVDKYFRSEGNASYSDTLQWMISSSSDTLDDSTSRPKQKETNISKSSAEAFNVDSWILSGSAVDASETGSIQERKQIPFDLAGQTKMVIVNDTLKAPTSEAYASERTANMIGSGDANVEINPDLSESQFGFSQELEGGSVHGNRDPSKFFQNPANKFESSSMDESFLSNPTLLNHPMHSDEYMQQRSQSGLMNANVVGIDLDTPKQSKRQMHIVHRQVQNAQNKFQNQVQVFQNPAHTKTLSPFAPSFPMYMPEVPDLNPFTVEKQKLNQMALLDNQKRQFEEYQRAQKEEFQQKQSMQYQQFQSFQKIQFLQQLQHQQQMEQNQPNHQEQHQQQQQQQSPLQSKPQRHKKQQQKVKKQQQQQQQQNQNLQSNQPIHDPNNFQPGTHKQAVSKQDQLTQNTQNHLTQPKANQQEVDNQLQQLSAQQRQIQMFHLHQQDSILYQQQQQPLQFQDRPQDSRQNQEIQHLSQENFEPGQKLPKQSNDQFSESMNDVLSEGNIQKSSTKSFDDVLNEEGAVDSSIKLEEKAKVTTAQNRNQGVKKKRNEGRVKKSSSTKSLLPSSPLSSSSVAASHLSPRNSPSVSHSSATAQTSHSSFPRSPLSSHSSLPAPPPPSPMVSQTPSLASPCVPSSLPHPILPHHQLHQQPFPRVSQISPHSQTVSSANPNQLFSYPSFPQSDADVSYIHPMHHPPIQPNPNFVVDPKIESDSTSIHNMIGVKSSKLEKGTSDTLSSASLHDVHRMEEPHPGTEPLHGTFRLSSYSSPHLPSPSLSDKSDKKGVTDSLKRKNTNRKTDFDTQDSYMNVDDGFHSPKVRVSEERMHDAGDEKEKNQGVVGHGLGGEKKMSSPTGSGDVSMMPIKTEPAVSLETPEPASERCKMGNERGSEIPVKIEIKKEGCGKGAVQGDSHGEDGEEYDDSVEAVVLKQLRHTMSALELSTRLCIRDALYRLSRSAFHRQNLSRLKEKPSASQQNHESQRNNEASNDEMGHKQERSSKSNEISTKIMNANSDGELKTDIHDQETKENDKEFKNPNDARGANGEECEKKDKDEASGDTQNQRLSIQLEIETNPIDRNIANLLFHRPNLSSSRSLPMSIPNVGNSRPTPPFFSQELNSRYMHSYGSEPPPNLYPSGLHSIRHPGSHLPPQPSTSSSPSPFPPNPHLRGPPWSWHQDVAPRAMWTEPSIPTSVTPLGNQNIGLDSNLSERKSRLVEDSTWRRGWRGMSMEGSNQAFHPISEPLHIPRNAYLARGSAVPFSDDMRYYPMLRRNVKTEQSDDFSSHSSFPLEGVTFSPSYPPSGASSFLMHGTMLRPQYPQYQARGMINPTFPSPSYVLKSPTVRNSSPLVVRKARQNSTSKKASAVGKSSSKLMNPDGESHEIDADSGHSAHDTAAGSALGSASKLPAVRKADDFSSSQNIGVESYSELISKPEDTAAEVSGETEKGEKEMMFGEFEMKFDSTEEKLQIEEDLKMLKSNDIMDDVMDLGDSDFPDFISEPAALATEKGDEFKKDADSKPLTFGSVEGNSVVISELDLDCNK